MKIAFETERLLIRNISIDDMNSDFMSWFNDEDLMKYYTNSRKKITREDIVKNIEDGFLNETSFTFGVFDKMNKKIIGTLKLGPINKAHKISDLVILIGDKSYHGKGVSVEAIKAGIDIAFNSFQLRKLFGGMYASNVSSIKAYTRAGWIVEGILKGHYWNNERNEDRILVGCFNPAYFSESDIEDAKFLPYYS